MTNLEVNHNKLYKNFLKFKGNEETSVSEDSMNNMGNQGYNSSQNTYSTLDS